VEQNQQEAMKWFIRAARQGDKTAQHNLGLHYASIETAEAAEAAEASEAAEEASPESTTPAS
jgi:TPR repeat protein